MLYERRAHQRVPTKLTVRWEGLLTDNYALMTDVSPGGCYINSAGRVSIDEQIGVETVLLSQAHLHLEGSVAHREWPLGFGLRFANLTDEKASLISQVIGEGV
jgi:PilZ domain-containing protein